MPYVNIKLAGEVTHEQKAQIAKEITETLERVEEIARMLGGVTMTANTLAHAQEMLSLGVKQS